MTARIIPQGFQDLSGGFEQNPFIAVPTTIANLALWLDASDTSTITQSGGAVSQWNDKSGLGNNATQGTGASQPVTASHTINGKNVLYFDGVAKFLDLSANATLLNITTGQNTVFAVAKTDNTGIAETVLRGMNSANNSRFYLRYSGTNTFDVLNGTTTTLSNAVTENTNTHIMAMVKNATTLTPIFDGVALTTGSAASNSISTLGIGRRTTSNVEAWSGDIAEIIMYTRALSNAEINRVGSYLATKWGTVWTNIDPSMTWGDLTGVTWGNLTPTEWGI